MTARCPLCRESTDLPSLVDRNFYRTCCTIDRLEGRPQLVGFILDDGKITARTLLLRQWAKTCYGCRDQFIRTRPDPLLRALDRVLDDNNRKIRQLELQLANLRLHQGALEGARNHVIKVRDEHRRMIARDSVESGYVYAILAGRRIKIGWARDLQSRIATLQTASAVELELLGSIVGFKRDERRVHERFKRYHVRGEWYRDQPTIRRFFGAASSLQVRSTTKPEAA